MSFCKSKRFFIAVFLLVLVGTLSVWFFAKQTLLNWDGERRAIFASPKRSMNQIIFYDGGFVDRDLSLCVQSAGQRPQFVANVWWPPDAYFSSGQWTKDGGMFVCSIIVKTVGDKPVKAVAFDFSENKSVVPPWLTQVSLDTRPRSDWLKQEKLIEELIAAHGGLSDSPITDDAIKAREKKLWFWQRPP